MARDLMFKDEIQQLVADAYLALEDPHGPAAVLYDDEQLARLPEPARDWAFGVGNPVPAAELRPGERVLDLGCGAGIDVLLAAQEVGPEGHVVGVDLLASMVERAREHAAIAGVDNVAFVAAEIEDLPLPDEDVDVVICNGVINLSARKSRALAEAFRVLRPGGRLCVADLTIDEEELPPEVLTHPSAWAGWVSGALAERVFANKLEKVGFTGLAVLDRQPFGLEDAARYPLFTDDVIDLMRRLVPESKQDEVAVAVTLTAHKPDQASR